MKRREFLVKSSAALAAVAASNLWVNRVMAGEAAPFGPSLLDTYFHVTRADIAKVLKMSPANIYRFFDSKKAIHEGVANLLMGEVETAVAVISGEPLSPKDRLREILATIHHMNAERYVGDAKLHEMVAFAMEESWESCEAHIDRLGMAVAKIVAEGVEAGQFRPCDIEVTAKCLCTAMCRFFHPQMIAECANKPEPTLDQMIEFVIGAISTGKA